MAELERTLALLEVKQAVTSQVRLVTYLGALSGLEA